jgi:hypothetical protein
MFDNTQLLRNTKHSNNRSNNMNNLNDEIDATCEALGGPSNEVVADLLADHLCHLLILKRERFKESANLNWNVGDTVMVTTKLQHLMCGQMLTIYDKSLCGAKFLVQDAAGVHHELSLHELMNNTERHTRDA